MVERVDPQILQAWLEWAAVRLIALPAGRIKPQDVRAYWPDFQREVWPGTSDLQTNRIRALAPSAEEIPIIDKIILLPNLCESREVRRVLHWRAQVHPIRQTHLLKWNWIAQKLGVKIYTVKRWHGQGLVEVGRKIDHSTVCHISTFLSDRL